MFCSIIPIIITIACLPQIQSCSSSKRIYPVRSVHWTELKFNKGDLLSCDINLVASHILLATSPSNVAHMVSDKSSSFGRLEEESWESYHRREGDQQTICFKRAALSPFLAVERAREDIARYRGQDIYYNLSTCNCEHWVNKWATDNAFSYQSLQWASSDCDVEKEPIRNNLTRHEVNGHGDACYSDCTKSTDGKYYCKVPNSPKGLHHCSPRRGTTYKGKIVRGNVNGRLTIISVMWTAIIIGTAVVPQLKSDLLRI